MSPKGGTGAKDAWASYLNSNHRWQVYHIGEAQASKTRGYYTSTGIEETRIIGVSHRGGAGIIPQVSKVAGVSHRRSASVRDAKVS